MAIDPGAGFLDAIGSDLADLGLISQFYELAIARLTMRFINPKTDYAFKRIFGSSESKEILISFLNALIYEGRSTIEDLEIIDPNLPPRLEGLKDSFLDVKARLNDGTLVIIEMQVLNVQSFPQRVLFNAAKTYALQLKAGEGYRMLKPVIALTITDFKMFDEFEDYASRFVYQEVTKQTLYPSRDIELLFIELPKFNKELDEIETLAEKWIYFMKFARSLDAIPEKLEDIPELNRAFEIANQAGFTPGELEDFERREMFIYDQQGAVMLGREEGREQGREEGIEEGIEIGKQQGIEIGKQEGIELGEKEKQRAIARKMLARFDDAEIAEMTELSIEEVGNLRLGN